MTNSSKLPVLDHHDRDGMIIGYAATACEAEAILTEWFLQCTPTADETFAFESDLAVYCYDAGTQVFTGVPDFQVGRGYWANA